MSPRVRIVGAAIAGALAMACIRSWARAAEQTAPGAPSSAVHLGGMRVTGHPVTPDSTLAPLPVEEIMPEGAVAAGGEEASNGEWLIAPIPGYTPVFGATLAVGVAKLYRPRGLEQEPRAWMTGGGAFLAENDSWGVALGHKMGFGRDTWRITAAAAYGDLIYKFYGIGNDAGDNDQSITLGHQAGAAQVSGLCRVGSRWFAGASLGGIDSRIHIMDEVIPPDFELPPGLGTPEAVFTPLLVSLAPRVQYDSRDSEFYPTHGVLFEVKVGLAMKALSSDFEFQAYEVSFNRYFSRNPDGIFAVRVFGRLARGDVPFFALSSLGQGSDLRGYTPGRYRDNALLTAQAEYRHRLAARWHAVVFGGVGAVGPELDELGSALPAGGVGLRFVLAEENHVAMRLDLAWGKDDDAVYLSVGEAF